MRMKIEKDYEPEFESIKGLLLEMAQERSVDSILRMIVERMAMRLHVALARIWLIRQGDLCERCAMGKECPGRRNCLHLVASRGTPLRHDPQNWSRLDGLYARVPLGVTKIGLIASRGEAGSVVDIRRHPEWIERNPWALGEEIISFAGQPMLYKGEVLGVVGIYFRIPPELVKKGSVWLRMVADHAAIAIANARAYQEIERLRSQLELENVYLREELDEVGAFGDIIGRSPALLKILRQIEMVAPTDTTVLILGESGTGKELVAREIHRRSLRRDRPLIKVNCASIPSELYESEFFGHTKGAFTGAVKERAGRFEAADGGTLFLDEVGEIPYPLQSKLLRVLQDGEYERIGEERTRKVDVRIIAATNKDIQKEVEEGNFRRDLYYRISVFPLEIPPLRHRKEDIPLLAEHFLDRVSGKLNLPRPKLTRANLAELQEYDWPGNVRELQNVIERALIISQRGHLRFDLPARPKDGALSMPAPAPVNLQGTEILTEVEMKQLEKKNLLAALQLCRWKVSGPGGAAELLGVKPTTLKARIRKMGIQRPR